MKLSVKSEYACLSLIALAKQHNEGFIPIAKIAEQQQIPKKFLEQILLTLKRNRYVNSKLGPDGGYILAKPPDQITVAEIIRLMDGALAPSLSVSEYFYQPTPIERSAKLSAVLTEIRNYISDKLESITVQDLV